MDLGLANKLCLVTGSTAGIGYATARLLAREGAQVVLNGRNEQRLGAAAEQLRAAVPSAKVSLVSADLAKPEGAAKVIAAFPELDVLINNAGIFEPRPFEEIRDDEWTTMFETNVMSGVRLSRHYLPRMLAKNAGRIVFVSSESAVQIPVEMIHYGMTKTAQLAVARGLAERTRGTGVTVNSVLPGPTASEGVSEFVRQLGEQSGRSAAEQEREFFATARPSSLLGRFATVDEVANLIVYAASARASATNGAALRVDGGVVRSIV
jgi:NAD(P)-dependent dehydrogenase (short-subunit alcohol dehydrogenase family)